MDYKVGKVTEFDKYVGEITDNENKYMFLDTDLQENVSVGDTVVFQSENIEGSNRAFLVVKAETFKNIHRDSKDEDLSNKNK